MESGTPSPATETENNHSDSPKGRCCCRGDHCHHGHRHCRRARCWIIALVVIGLVGFFAHTAHPSRFWDCTSRGGTTQFSHPAGADAPHMAGWMVDRMFYDVKANDDQRTKARAIVDAAAGDLQGLVRQHDESHQALLALLREPTFDRAKLEALRARSMTDVDGASKRISTALGDLAELLTPAQRQQLADSLEKRRNFR